MWRDTCHGIKYKYKYKYFITVNRNFGYVYFTGEIYFQNTFDFPLLTFKISRLK